MICFWSFCCLKKIESFNDKRVKVENSNKYTNLLLSFSANNVFHQSNND